MGLFFFFAILILQSPSGLPWGAFLAVIVGLAPTISEFPCFPFSLVMFGAAW